MWNDQFTEQNQKKIVADSVCVFDGMCNTLCCAIALYIIVISEDRIIISQPILRCVFVSNCRWILIQTKRKPDKITRYGTIPRLNDVLATATQKWVTHTMKKLEWKKKRSSQVTTQCQRFFSLHIFASLASRYHSLQKQQSYNFYQHSPI